MYLHRDTPNNSVADCMHGQQCGRPDLAPAPCFPTCTYQGSYIAARSYHPGGVNVVCADGHVDFYDDAMDLHVWQALSTIAGGEIITK